MHGSVVPMRRGRDGMGICCGCRQVQVTEGCLTRQAPRNIAN